MATNPPNIGQLAPDDAQRDAIHVAIAPVIAAERLPHGSAVAWAPGQEGTAVINVPWDHPNKLGIVDPFRTGFVNAGERFWLFLMPNTVTSLRHEWTHPAFTTQAPVEQKAEPTEAQILAAVEQACNKLGYDFDSYNGEITICRGDGDRDDDPRVWEYAEDILGTAIPSVYRRTAYFTCAC